MVIAHLLGAPAKSREPETVTAGAVTPGAMTQGRDSGTAPPAYPNPPARVTGAINFLTRRNKRAGPGAGKLWKTYAALQSIRLRNPG